jgi:hypothetical protein
MQGNDISAGDREAAGAIAGMQETYGTPPAEPVTEGNPGQFESLAKAEQGAKDERHDFIARAFPHGTPGVALADLVTKPVPMDLLVVDTTDME